MSPIPATHQDPECLTAAEEAELVQREKIRNVLETALEELAALQESVALLLALDGDAGYDYLQSRSRMVPYDKERALVELYHSLQEWHQAVTFEEK